VCFRVTLDHFRFVVLLIFVGFGFSVPSQEKNVSEMTYFVSSGTQNLTPFIRSHVLSYRYRIFVLFYLSFAAGK